MTVWRRARQRRFTGRHPNADRYLSREERLGRVICAAVHDSGCTCQLNSSHGTCSQMTWAAKRAIRHLEKEGHSQ
jgi:hypothetical protein